VAAQAFVTVSSGPGNQGLARGLSQTRLLQGVSICITAVPAPVVRAHVAKSQREQGRAGGPRKLRSGPDRRPSQLSLANMHQPVYVWQIRFYFAIYFEEI
jgi:hypothetical protein